MTTEEYKHLLPSLPIEPGVYRFIDANDVIIYVGKAKNLKNRIASYFGSTKGMNRKTIVMVKTAARIEYTIVETETDALLLENTLIKRHQPRYNVQLKDGKTYPYICIKNERFPRVFITRQVPKDGSTYFGPYISKFQAYTLMNLINDMFQLRTCNFNLSESNIKKGKFKVCLEYHIQNCLGACVGNEEEEHYNKKITQINNMLKGNFGPVKAFVHEQMQSFVEQLKFEQAQKMKESLAAFENYQGKSLVASPNIGNVDVFSILKDEKLAFVNYLNIINGNLINTFTLELKINLDQDEQDILEFAVLELRERFRSTNTEIITNHDLILPLDDIQITVPKIGDKFKLLELSRKNARHFQLEAHRQAMNKEKRLTPSERILTQLKIDLNMDRLPVHIECFDNSNIQGSHPVASMVCFKQAKPSKKDYRHYNIKTVEGPDDFASMEEVVYRRYKRLLEENQNLPQLIVIDGGKGQLSSAMVSIRELGLENKIKVIGIAKKLEEIYSPDDGTPLHLNKRSESLKLLQKLRNEAHRFAITFHRNQRSKLFTTSELTDIPGIGEKTAQTLLHAFKSVKRIREATFAELSNEIGNSAAKKVMEYFAKQPE